MGTKNQDAALDVIGQKLKQKAEIDKPFNEMDLVKDSLKISKSTDTPTPRTLSYEIDSPDAGFNCLCELNLGKAYMYSCQKDEEGNIVNEKRVYYPKSYKCALNEKWLDFVLKQIEEAKNPMVVVSDIFTRVTTGNMTDTLPYTEQLRYIYKKLNKPEIKSKIVALVRGEKEKEILNYSGIDLMGKLANMLGMQDKLVDAGIHLSVDINESPRSISMLHFNKKATSVKSLAIAMQKYATENPGHDVYFCTNARLNWQSCGVTTYTDKDGTTHQKPCWFISFGGMYEYDKFNEKRPELGPYTLNKCWYKVIFDEEMVRTDSVDYIYPHATKIDSSSYVSSVIANDFEEKFATIMDTITPNYKKVMEKVTKETRKQVTKVVHGKKTTKTEETSKTDKVMEG